MSKQLITIGRATQEGTKFFKNRHNSIKFNKIRSLGLRVSPIGIGTFRLKEIPEHCQAISNALSNGLNLIDSSNHFQNGESEETVGKVLEAEFKNGLNRSEVIICTKAGFIFGKAPKGSLHIKGDNYYNINPDYLKDQITNSLTRLRLETLDIFYIVNPERILQASEVSMRQEDVYEQIKIAFDYLDKEVDSGRIASYGIASNSIGITTAVDHLSMAKILEMRPKHLCSVQYPLNMYELNALDQGFDGSSSLTEICTENELYQVTQRPFNAITPEGIRKLRMNNLNESESMINEHATRQFALVAEMEYELSMTLGINSEDIALASKFVISQIISENLVRLVPNGMAAELYFKRDLIPELDKDLQVLSTVAESADPHTGEVLRRWIESYKSNVLTLMDEVLKISKWHADRSNSDLLNMISLTAYRGESLECNALGIAMSANPKGTVLSGVRTSSHVANIKKALKLPLLSEDRLGYLSQILSQ